MSVPANAKKPADRKPKTDDVPESLTATIRDREWSIPRAALDDFELLDAFSQLQQEEDGTQIPFILRRLLGDQWRAAMALLRDEDTGRVTIEAGAEFTQELMGALNPNS